MFEFVGDGAVNAYRWMMEHLFLINIVFSLLIIFFQRRNPTTVWAWLLLLYFIPVLGFVLYLILGQNFRRERMFKMKEIEGEIKYAVRRQEESIYRKKLRLRDPELDRFKRLILYNLNEAEAVLTDNNDIRIFTDGREKFKTLLAEMDHARNYIHVQYYIIKNDELWKEIEFWCARRGRAWKSASCSTVWGAGECTIPTGRALRRRESRWQNSFRLCLGSCSSV